MYKTAVIHIVNGDRQKCGTAKTAEVMNDDIRPTYILSSTDRQYQHAAHVISPFVMADGRRSKNSTRV